MEISHVVEAIQNDCSHFQVKSNSNFSLIWAPQSLKVSVNDDPQLYYFRFSVQSNVLGARMEIFDVNTLDDVFSIDLDLITMIAVVADENDCVETETIVNNMLIIEVEYSRLEVFSKLKFVGSLENNISAETLRDEMVEPLKEDMKRLTFILGQYTFFIGKTAENLEVVDMMRAPNILARGIESTGTFIRHGLRATGEVTANVIIAAERSYTRYLSAPAAVAKEFTEEDVEYAKKQEEYAKNLHAATSSLAGTILYPVRWTGMKAAELSKGEELRGVHPVQKAVVDTVAGIGNAVTSVAKGITEAIGVVGAGIGNAAVHYSTSAYGEEYTENVTQHYVNAGEAIGKTGYKVTNLITNGASGVFLSAVVEGTDMVINLFEYLVGPVLLQGVIGMAQLPFTTPTYYFAVLRPWSISFYTSASDFTSKPFKVLATSLLDTLPVIREDEITVPEGYSALDNSLADFGSPTSDIGHQLSDEGLQTGHRKRRIELCTVDCSTYLLWPEEAFVEDWFAELKAASQRVETIAKRRSGAAEICETRRGRMLPKSSFIRMKIGCAGVRTDDRASPMSPYDILPLSRNSILAQAAEPQAQVTTLGSSTCKDSCGDLAGLCTEDKSKKENCAPKANDDATPEKSVVGIAKTPQKSPSTPSTPKIGGRGRAKKNRLELLSSAPALFPSIQETAHGVTVWLRDIARVLVLQSAHIEVTPVSHTGRRLEAESHETPWAVLHPVSNNVSADMLANWTYCGPTGQMEFGRDLSIDRRTCAYLEVTMQADLTCGGTLLLGLGRIDLTEIPPVGAREKEIWCALSGGKLAAAYVQVFASSFAFENLTGSE